LIDAKTGRPPLKCEAYRAMILIAVNIAKLPSVPRRILKHIPRPPKTRPAGTIERERLAQLWPTQIRREFATTNCHSGRV
jgi:hypothetical protein